MSKKNAFSQAFSELISTVTPGANSNEETKQAAPAAPQPEAIPERPRVERPTESWLTPKPPAGQKMTVIAAGTTVNGNLTVDGSAEIDGCLNGDIECTGCLTVSGEIIGGSKISEIDVIGARIEGNIESKGSVNVRNGAVIIGNITGQSMQIFGAVKGSVVLPGHLTIGSTAIILGDIRTGSIDIQNGAVIDGHVSVQSSGRTTDVFDRDKSRREQPSSN